MPSVTTEDTFTAIFTPNDTDNFNIIEVEVPVIVNKASVNISVTDIEKTYGDASFDLGAISVGTITYTSSNSEIITVEGNNGVIKGAGIATITATAYLNDNYETATGNFVVTVKQAIPEIMCTEKA